MGGLVSRSFVMKYHEPTRRDDTRLFVAISSPEAGSESAAGIENAPEDLIVYSSFDMNPKSDFIRGLFHQPPDCSAAHFPTKRISRWHRRDESSLGPSGDGVLTLRSAGAPARDPRRRIRLKIGVAASARRALDRIRRDASLVVLAGLRRRQTRRRFCRVNFVETASVS